MKIILLYFALSISSNLLSQITITDSIWYEPDNSYRKYKVWLPEDYDSSKTYQTIYTLDASLLFNPIVSSVEIYSYPDVGALPPTIVAGLFFDQRNDEMGINWNDGSLFKLGEAFKNLIKSVLIPTIEKNYSVSNYRSIVGHSNSSTFIKSFLWDEESLFNGYLSMSEYQFDTIEAQFCGLSIPADNPINYTFVSGKQDAEYRYESGIKHEQILDSCSPPNLRFTHIKLENADHLTMVPQGIPLGLEALYEDYHTSSKSAKEIAFHLNNLSPVKYVDSLVSSRSEKYGLVGAYQFDDINLLYDIYLELSDSLNTWHATKKYSLLYNDSSEYFYEAQVLESMGAIHSAEKSYLKHLNYYPTPGIWSYKRIVWLYLYKLNNYYQAIYWIEQGYKDLSELELLELSIKIVKKDKSFRKRCVHLLESIARTKQEAEITNSIQKMINRIEALK